MGNIVDIVKHVLDDMEIQIEFDEKKHLYLVNGQKYTSVNEYIKKFVKEPDYDKIAEEINRYRFDDVRNEWEKRKNEAIDKGKELHKFAEDYFYGNAKIGLYDKFLAEKKAIMEFYSVITSEYNHEIIGVEKKVICDELKVAGTIDLISYSKNSNRVFILDWKTNKDLFKNAGIFIPEDRQIDLKDKYALQLSMYKYMLEFFLPEEIEIKIGVIHVTGDEKIGFIYYPLNCFPKDILYQKQPEYEVK